LEDKFPYLNCGEDDIKATDDLAQRKAEATKTTLPPVAKKTTKLMKVNENLLRRKTDAAKVAATEKEKKKTQDVASLVILEKKIVSKRKNHSVSKKDKEIVNENPQPEAVKPQAKKQRTEKVFEDDGDVDVVATPQIQPSTFYRLKTREIEEPKDQPIEIPVDPVEAEAIEAHSEQVRLYFSSICPPGERLK
jgi:hypothetical protein